MNTTHNAGCKAQLKKPKTDAIPLGGNDGTPGRTKVPSKADLTGQTSKLSGTVHPPKRLSKPPVFLRPCPAPGEGVNVWLMGAAWDAFRGGLSQAEAEVAIRNQITRSPSHNEIQKALNKVYGEKPTAGYTRPIRTVYSQQKLAELASRLPGFGVDHLRRKSLVDPTNCSTLQYLHRIYRGRERALVFDKMVSNEPLIWERNADGVEYGENELAEFRNPSLGMGAWFLANPVNGDWVELERLKSDSNRKGKSLRAEENLTDWRFLVIESDIAPSELWIPAMAQLPIRIVSIVTSGGRSVHVLIDTGAKDKIEWEAVKNKIGPMLVELGADKGALSAIRLTRLPGCFRAEKGQMQRLLFLNPNADGTPICELPDQRN